MRLHPLTGPLEFEFQALSAALMFRETNTKLWIIRAGADSKYYLVCQEASFGEYAMPLCHNWFGVFNETDRFTDPTWRISLGPGVWPSGE